MKRYRNNRLWGDNIVEALWWSLCGKEFPSAELIQKLNQKEKRENNASIEK